MAVSTKDGNLQRTEYERRPDVPEASGWAVGGVVFAAVLMILIGAFQALIGIAAIAEDEFFVLTRNYAFDVDVTTFGWIHLVLGALVAISGIYLLAGRAWAGIVAITLAVLSAVANFFFIPYEPWWAMLVIALDVWVIWALTRPGVFRTD